MDRAYSLNDEVYYQHQGPQGRNVSETQKSIYTVVKCLPIESDGYPRYRIKSGAENFERVVTEDQMTRAA